MVVRALPRIEEKEEKAWVRRSLFERWMVSELPERADLYLSSLLAKWLRKLKVFLLKTDNMLSEHLKKRKPHNGKSESNGGGFADMMEGEKEE